MNQIIVSGEDVTHFELACLRCQVLWRDLISRTRYECPECGRVVKRNKLVRRTLVANKLYREATEASDAM